jgi:hypothetical protein
MTGFDSSAGMLKLAPAAARDDRRLHRSWLPDRRDQ